MILKKETIKTIDESLVACEKIKAASDNVTRGVNNASGKTINKVEVIGKKSMVVTRNNIIRIKRGTQKPLTKQKVIRVNELSKPTVKVGNGRIKKPINSTAKARRIGAETARQQKGATGRARKATVQSAKTTKELAKML